MIKLFLSYPWTDFICAKLIFIWFWYFILSKQNIEFFKSQPNFNILKIIENIEYCESIDVPTGPGRGSAAGALTLFVNHVTKIIDPIKYELLFFRFLTKDRKDPPDCFLIA